jgi:hypothetical protein
MEPKDKHLSEEEIALCVEAIQDKKYSKLPSSVRKHLEICHQCAIEVIMVGEVSMGALSDSLVISKKRKNLFWIGGIAAAAAVIILFFAINPFNNNLNNETLLVQNNVQDTIDNGVNTELVADSTKAAGSEKQKPTKTNKSEEKTPMDLNPDLLAAYSPEKDLEKLCQNFNNSYRGEDISILSKSELSYPNSDSLLWLNPEADLLGIEIYNNKAKLMHGFETTNNGIQIPKLENGLYYWKLINEDFDLLYVGKIRVETK